MSNIKQFSRFEIKKKNRYEQLPLNDGKYLVVAIGSWHGMSVGDRDFINTDKNKSPDVALLVKLNGSLISTKPISIPYDELMELYQSGYIQTVDQVELYNAIHRIYSLDKNDIKVVEIAVYTAQEFQDVVSQLKKKIMNNDVVYVHRPINRDTGEVQKGSVTFNGNDTEN